MDKVLQKQTKKKRIRKHISRSFNGGRWVMSVVEDVMTG